MKVQKIMHLRVRTNAFSEPEMKGGATVIIDGSTDTTQVQVRVAMCNPQDVFCKKAGRLQAEKAIIDVIALRSLPGVLGQLHKEIHRRAHVKTFHRPSYDHKVREFLPK
jgi:hypothetical protein